MAMLAEKRTKTRYYLHHKTLDPRGNAWCEDTNKFGQKMLEKMGWSQGKGLGAQENGSTDPVHVSYKWDNKGMGYKGADGDEAVAQQKDFDALLATLSGSTEDKKNEPLESPLQSTKSPKSLELLSQKSRARVHYHKFTRGKDLSRASSKDLACILGVTAESKPAEPSLAVPAVVPDVGPPIEPKLETTFGITTIAKGNINEYFKQKFNERKRKLSSIENSAESSDEKSDFVPSNVDNNSEEAEASLSNLGKSDKDKKKKKKRKSTAIDTEDGSSGNVSILNDTLMSESDVSVAKGRRKSVTWGEVEVSFVSKYIKDMQDTSSESVSMDSTIEEKLLGGVECVGIDPKFVTVIPDKREKKKKKHEYSLSDSNLFKEEEDSERIKKKKKKRDKSVVSSDDHGNDNMPEIAVSVDLNKISEDTAVNIVEGSSTKKKKKKKEKVEVCGISQGEALVSHHEDCGNPESTPSSETVHKKSKKKKKTVHPVEDISDAPTLSATSNCDGDSEYIELESNKSTSKKKKFRQNKIDVKVENEKNLEVVSDQKVPSISRKKEKRKQSPVQEEADVSVIPEGKKSSKKRKLEIEESCVSPVQEEADLSVIPEGKKSSKKRKLEIEESCVSQVTLEEKQKKKKKKKQVLEDNEESKTDFIESSSLPSLSALTQERMAKWKDRRKNKAEHNGTEEMQTEAVRSKKERKTGILQYNPDLPSQDYNHRKVLSVLGYNVKETKDKKVIIQMPESNFPGSNLDGIAGYGQTIKSF